MDNNNFSNEKFIGMSGFTFRDFCMLIQEAYKAELFRNGVKFHLPYSHILCMVDGKVEKPKPELPYIWHDAKNDPPQTPGLYYVKKDNTNSMYLCNYVNGEWALAMSVLKPGIDVIQWTDYTNFAEEK